MSLTARLSAELKGDKVIWVVMALLGLFSLLAVYSASIYLSNRFEAKSTERYLFEHFMMLAAGFSITYVLHRWYYEKFNNFAPYMMLIAVPLLVFTLFFGVETNSASRWVLIPGLGYGFQTSDFARLALILYVARVITKKQDVIKDFQQAFLPIIVPIIIVVGLIAPSNLSTALIIFFVCLTMMFIGRVDVKYLFVLFLCGCVLFALLLILGEMYPDHIRSATWYSRIGAFVTGSGDQYQAQGSLIAIANGGLFGVGPGNSLQRNNLPYAYADYIYAIIVEEYGILGGFFVMCLYVLLFFRIIRLVARSPKTFGAIACIGIGLNILVQALANMAVSVNLMPVTGLTLPLISKGGSSLIFTCASLGIVLSVSRHIEKVT